MGVLEEDFQDSGDEFETIDPGILQVIPRYTTLKFKKGYGSIPTHLKSKIFNAIINLTTKHSSVIVQDTEYGDSEEHKRAHIKFNQENNEMLITFFTIGYWFSFPPITETNAKKDSAFDYKLRMQNIPADKIITAAAIIVSKIAGEEMVECTSESSGAFYQQAQEIANSILETETNE